MANYINSNFLRQGHNQLWKSEINSVYKPQATNLFLSLHEICSKFFFNKGFITFSLKLYSKHGKYFIYCNVIPYKTKLLEGKKKINEKESLDLSIYELQEFLQHTFGKFFVLKVKNILSPGSYYANKLKPALLNIESKLLKQRRFNQIGDISDAINIIALSLFFKKADILSDYLSRLIKKSKKVFNVIKLFESLLIFFKILQPQNVSVRIVIKGKLRGQRNMASSYTIDQGFKFPKQNAGKQVDFHFTPSLNLAGIFGIKVWIFY